MDSRQARRWKLSVPFSNNSEPCTQKTLRVDDRVVSISQPHIRPIVRGKAKAETEFGVKVAVSMVDVYIYLDQLSWDPLNESIHMQQAGRRLQEALCLLSRGRLSGPNLSISRKWVFLQGWGYSSEWARFWPT